MIILTSSFGTVANELAAKQLLPSAPCNVAFITTAGNPYDETPWIKNDRVALERLGYDVERIDIAEMDTNDVVNEIQDKQIIFVAGGNTSYLARAAKKSGFIKAVHVAMTRGAIYIGSSAGSILAGPSVEPFLEEDNQEIGERMSLDETQNDAIERTFSDRFSFVKLTDQEYRVT